MHLSVLMRPDISYSVSFRRLLRYFQKTRNITNLHAFVDYDCASCNIDRRSYIGYCFVSSGCVISYESQKQEIVALSSTQAEYMVLAEAS